MDAKGLRSGCLRAELGRAELLPPGSGLVGRLLVRKGETGEAEVGERAGRSDLLKEALGAVEGAFEVYTAAGFRHYEADFRDRIQALTGAIEQAKRTG